VKETLVLRERFAVDDRTFTVLGEPWFDQGSGEWKGRFLFVPLDHSLPRPVVTPPLFSAHRRDELMAALGRASDRDLTRAVRAVTEARSNR
jgi:hypothetical protein